MDSMDYIDARVNDNVPDATPAFAWIILLPLFFIAGWYTHDIIKKNDVPIKPQAGIGGGPFDTDPGMQLHIYEVKPETSLPLSSPTPSHTFNGQQAIEEI